MYFMKKHSEQIIATVAFVFFILITCYELTGSSLWYDEAIEYWYSKIMVGELPMAGVADGTVSMYQRILLTYQPPLYNIIMYFWLKVSDSELWFRSFGVFMGLVGMMGTYKSVRKVVNGWAASLTVICAATIYQLYSYWQECAEYCLVLAVLCWVVYFWICLMQEINFKNMICFTVTCVVAVYSQYGAIFPVVALAFIAYIHILWRRNRRNAICINATYMSAFLFAAIPLYCFFLKQQIMHQRMERNSILIPQFPDGILLDFFESLNTTFYWNFFSYIYDQTRVRNILIAIMVLLTVSLIFGKQTITKLMILANVLCWLVYYVAVKFGIYSYGNFGRRYNLFFIPLWIVLFTVVCGDICLILSDILRTRIYKIPLLKGIFMVTCLCFLCYYTVFNWTGKLRFHAYKSDIRGSVQEWYGQAAYEEATIVYYAAVPGFAYYVRQNEYYDEHTEEGVSYMAWLRDLNVDGYTSFVEAVYGTEWPEKVYIVASNYVEDLDTLAECFTRKGYVREDLYDLHAGKLIYLFRADKGSGILDL